MREGVVSVGLPRLGLVTVLLPLSALVFCLVWSVAADLEKATYTHCEVPQFAPSISAVIGGFSPQAHVWKAGEEALVSIALSCAPGFLFGRLYYSYFRDRLTLGALTPRLVTANFVLNTAENFSLVGLSFVPSSDVFVIHEAFFITFLGTSILSMCLVSFYFYPRCGYQPKNLEERKSVACKLVLTKLTLAAAVLALYFYWRHNELCEPYVYSLFGLCEYTIVLCNILHHAMVVFDFSGWSLHTDQDQILLK